MRREGAAQRRGDSACFPRDLIRTVDGMVRLGLLWQRSLFDSGGEEHKNNTSAKGARNLVGNIDKEGGRDKRNSVQKQEGKQTKEEERRRRRTRAPNLEPRGQNGAGVKENKKWARANTSRAYQRRQRNNHNKNDDDSSFAHLRSLQANFFCDCRRPSMWSKLAPQGSSEENAR